MSWLLSTHFGFPFQRNFALGSMVGLEQETLVELRNKNGQPPCLSGVCFFRWRRVGRFFNRNTVAEFFAWSGQESADFPSVNLQGPAKSPRSEERRVGKESRSRWSPYQDEKKRETEGE